MNPWKRLILFLSRGHAPCSGCYVRVEFTGAPPRHPSEDLLRKASGGRRSVWLHRLEEQVAEALYHEALRRGGWSLDIGVWGPAAYRKEASRIVADIQPEFGHLIEDGESNRPPKKRATGRV